MAVLSDAAENVAVRALVAEVLAVLALAEAEFSASLVRAAVGADFHHVHALVVHALVVHALVVHALVVHAEAAEFLADHVLVFE